MLNLSFIDGCEAFLYNRSDGYQEVRYFTNGQWYYLCSQSLSNSQAKYICQQFGPYEFRSIRYLSFDALDNSIPIYPFIHTCLGTEDSFCNCNVTSQPCDSDYVALLECTLPGNYDLSLPLVSSTLPGQTI